MTSLLAFIAQILLVTAATTLDYTQTTALTSGEVPSGAALIVETNAAVIIEQQPQISISTLTVNQGGEFFYFTGTSSSNINVNTIVNNGFILFDTSASVVNYALGNNLQNYEEIVIYGFESTTDLSFETNAGQLTFWGSSGQVITAYGTNTGNICYYQSQVMYNAADGNGCFVFYNSYGYFDYPSGGFQPTIVFAGGSFSSLTITNAFQIVLKLVNLGKNYSILLTSQGFVGFSYDAVGGILSVQQSVSSPESTFNIGTGYDQTLFQFPSDGRFITVSYGAPAPSGANKGGCSCVLHTSIPTVVASTSSSTISSQSPSTEISTSSTESSSIVSSSTESSSVESPSTESSSTSSSIESSESSSAITLSSSSSSEFSSSSSSTQTSSTTTKSLHPEPTVCNHPTDAKIKEFCDRIKSGHGFWYGHYNGDHNDNHNDNGKGNGPGNNGNHGNGNDNNNGHNGGGNNGHNDGGNTQGKGNDNNNHSGGIIASGIIASGITTIMVAKIKMIEKAREIIPAMIMEKIATIMIMIKVKGMDINAISIIRFNGPSSTHLIYIFDHILISD